MTHDTSVGQTADRSWLVTKLTVVATLGGLLFGYDTAVISGAVSAIDLNFIDPRQLSETERNSLSGFTISSALFGCIIGAAVSGWIADAWGRRAGLMISAITFFISSIGAAIPEMGLTSFGVTGAAALVPFNIYRIIGGVGVGLASTLSPLYIAEISPRAHRGRLVSYNQMAIVLGITFVYFVNWLIALQGDTAWLTTVGWRWMFASEAIPAFLFLILLFGVPDSPRWLVMKDRRVEARRLLVSLDGEEEARTSIAEIEDSLRVRHGKLFAFGSPLIVIGVMLAVFQQGVGINAVTYYAPMMFQNMGASNDAAFLQTIFVGATLAISTLLAIFTVDRFGRKPLLIAGAGIMAVSMLALGLQFRTGEVGFFTLTTILVYIAGFGMSWGPITWVMLAEIFPNSIKGRALAIAVTADWVANLGVSWSFKIMDGSTYLNHLFNHGFAYFLYGFMSLLALLFAVRYIPETKGKSLEAIQLLWSKES
jgi:SP family xylose:H+ symportor-like MFS transporter